ncbi:hypothetical protein [Neisseria zalophi]|nr:hypothetical protein [Neisseria zalophi]
MFAIKALGIYWAFYIIISLIFGRFFMEVAFNFFLILPTSLYLYDIVEWILRHMGFSTDLPSDLIRSQWIRTIIHYIFYSIHIFTVSFLLTFFLFSNDHGSNDEDKS